MTKNITTLETYEQYVQEMKLKISDLTEKLYEFKKTENNSGMSECSQLANLVMNLGSVSNALRGVLNNHIPIQYELLDEWLGNIDVNRLEPLFLTGLIRYSSVAKDGLKNWIPLRDKIAVRAESMGLDSKKILVGLY